MFLEVSKHEQNQKTNEPNHLPRAVNGGEARYAQTSKLPDEAHSAQAVLPKEARHGHALHLYRRKGLDVKSQRQVSR